jgi:hypothetical protein
VNKKLIPALVLALIITCAVPALAVQGRMSRPRFRHQDLKERT